MIYLDNAASTKVKPNCLKAFSNVAEYIYGNPSSEHTEGLLAETYINSSKGKISKMIHCDRDDIYFTSGATMSNQLLIQGFVAKHPDAMIVTTNVEHNDIVMCVNNLLVFRHILNVGSNGLIDIDKLSAILEYSADTMSVPTLVLIQMATSLERIFAQYEDRRLIITTFSSNVHRVQQIINASYNHGRKVAVLGRSMINVIGAAAELGI